MPASALVRVPHELILINASNCFFPTRFSLGLPGPDFRVKCGLSVKNSQNCVTMLDKIAIISYSHL